VERLAPRRAGATAPSPRGALGSGGGVGVLFVGRESKAHEDLEIVVAHANFAAVRSALRELTWFGAGGLAGEAGQVWPVDDAPAELHQTWGWDSVSECWRVDVFREPWDGRTWVCRREPSIRRPVADVIERESNGIPYLAPEVVLLFKAKHAARDKDAADFARGRCRSSKQNVGSGSRTHSASSTLARLDHARRSLSSHWSRLAWAAVLSPACHFLSALAA
jgi:hypothetical protein